MIATIGVYGFDRDSFLETLRGAEVNLVLDVRQRRGVRGAQYAWANARRLQAALAEAGIGYEHLPELRADDRAAGSAVPRGRSPRRGQTLAHGLAPEYVSGYTEQILDPVDLEPIVRFIGRNRAALLCVERDAEACHRSLIAARLGEKYGFEVHDLVPPP